MKTIIAAVFLCWTALGLDQTVQPVTETIKLRPGQVYRGNGAILIASGANPVLQLAERCAVYDVTIIGKTNIVGISADRARRWSMSNVRVGGCAAGVALSESWIGSLRDCHVTACTVGVLITNCNVNAIQIDGGEIAGNGTGILFAGRDHYGNAIRSCIEGNTSAGIVIEGETTSTLISGCYFEANGRADVIVNHRSAAGTKCIGNFHLRTAKGVWVMAGLQTAIADNTFMCQPYLIEGKATETFVGWNNLRTRIGNPWGDLKAFDRSATTVYATQRSPE